MSVAIVVDVHGLDPAIAAIEGLAHLPTEQLMSNIGTVLENSTRKRIHETKTSPDGVPWPPNRAGNPTLERTGENLLQSVAFIASASDVLAGAGWEHAHVHQNGMVISAKGAKKLHFVIGNQHIFRDRVTIPARPFVGMSEEDGHKVTELVTDFLGAHVGFGGGR